MAGLPPLRGAYGYGLGAIASTLVAKRLGGLDFLILGGGVYDLEDTWQKTFDESLKKEIEVLRKSEGDTAIEDRSIAYDISGLPKKVAIYHGTLDDVVPPTQAKAFGDSLESSGDYQVTLQMIEGVTHAIPEELHRKILENLTLSTAIHI